MAMQESGEMYLETIYILSQKYPDVRAIDVCESLGYSKPSVSRAIGLLRKDGILINFDGDYHHDHSEAPLPENHAHKDLTAAQNAAYAHIESEMCALQQPRPNWDMALLADAGYRDRRVDRGCWRRVYQEIDKFYNPTPIFCISARK